VSIVTVLKSNVWLQAEEHTDRRTEVHNDSSSALSALKIIEPYCAVLRFTARPSRAQ
jgi:hypothetical protein